MANYNSGYNYNSGFLYNTRIQCVNVGGTVNSSSSINHATTFLRQLVSSLASSSIILKSCEKNDIGNSSVSIGGAINRIISRSILAVLNIQSTLDRTSTFFRFVGYQFFYNMGLKYNYPIERNGNVAISGNTSQVRIFFRNIVSTVGISTALIRFSIFARAIGNAQITIASIISKGTNKSVSSGDIGVEGSMSRRIFKQVSAAISITSIVNKVSQYYRSMAGTLVSSKSLKKTTVKSFVANISIQSVFGKASVFYRNITSSVSISGTISKIAAFHRAFTGSSSITSLTTTAATFRRVLSGGAVTPTGNIVKTIYKSIFGEVIISKDIMEFVGNGAVAIRSHLRRKKYHFLVTLDGILQPLGVKVLRDSHVDIVPSARQNVEEIPGKHGEIDFGTELNKRLIELHVVTDEMTPAEKEDLKRECARQIVSDVPKTLVFEADMEKAYEVKYAGKIDPSQYPNWMDFVIPFKMSEPFINGSEEKELVGAGTLSNEGTFETGLIIEIVGVASNPTVVIDDVTLAYTGNIDSGQTLVIDTESQTAMIGTTNVLDGYNGEFPLLQPGDANVITDNIVTIRWRDKYL